MPRAPGGETSLAAPTGVAEIARHIKPGRPRGLRVTTMTAPPKAIETRDIAGVMHTFGADARAGARTPAFTPTAQKP